ncbi:efflux RND transporter periplasmic adaptor subunit [Roseomonas aeriglobus]|nr:efflux RND transporter periplasmic adaptor subunit [Roseomonas aeriglobus]MBN2973932.1 efflux RND transporter periplasmic adaptor subunit [Roseomonas aeriglobus]MBN2974388.1 efflux RND transporter periplasmic adaptor subunit [Roseomonas aeriglobus]
MFGNPVRPLLPLILLTLLSCSDREDQQRYETIDVQRGDLRDIVQAVGDVRQPIEMMVPVLADAQVVSVSARLGDHVVKGQPLARLSLREPSDAANDASIDLEQARIALEIAHNRQAKAAATFAGVKQLHEKGFVPNARLAAEAKDLESEQLNVRSAERKLAALTSRTSRLRTRVAEQEILRSPCSCTVEDVSIVPGQIVGPSLADAFYLAGGGDALQVKVKVPEQDLARAQQAENIRFSVDTAPNETFPATIAYISNRPIKEGRFIYYTISLSFTRSNPTIRPGMTANVEFVNADARNVLKVPVKALYFRPPDYIPLMTPSMTKALQSAKDAEERRLAIAMGEGYEFGFLFSKGLRRIFVLEGGKPVRRLIRVGEQGEDVFAAISGLRPGETVVLGEARRVPPKET